MLLKALIEKLKPSETFVGGSTGAASLRLGVESYSFDYVMLGEYAARSLYFGEALPNRSLLGMDILNRFRVSIDPERMKVVLEPTVTFMKRDKEVPGYAGIEVARQADGKIFIAFALDKYKDLVGSQLVVIDDEACQGKEIKELPLAQVQAILDGDAGTEAKITVRSKGVDRAVSLRRITPTEMAKARSNRVLVSSAGAITATREFDAFGYLTQKFGNVLSPSQISGSVTSIADSGNQATCPSQNK